ncbi:MAG: hypothetical protein IPO14_07330 [Saprospiraceae bacterium]|nr:hypothetical protein [Saprospiraceae bacterium]
MTENHRHFIFVFPTEYEALGVFGNKVKGNLTHFSINDNCEVSIKILEAGPPFFQAEYQKFISENKFSSNDTVVLVGIAGSNDPNIGIGDVVNIVSEKFLDLGAWNQDGTFIPWDELSFRKSMGKVNSFILEPLLANCLNASGTTVCSSSGYDPIFKELYKNNSIQVENMEGASFALVNKIYGINGHQIRSISNFVGPRDTSNWDIDKALSTLRLEISKFLDLCGRGYHDLFNIK